MPGVFSLSAARGSWLWGGGSDGNSEKGSWDEREEGMIIYLIVHILEEKMETDEVGVLS